VENDRSPEEIFAEARAELIDWAFSRIRELFESKDEKFEDEDAELLLTKLPPRPSFPFIILGASITKDILDWPLDLSLILTVVAFFISVAMGLILTFWCMGKISGGWWKKALIKWLWVRFFTMMAIEIIPFVQLVPANTIFVLMAYYKEKKIVKLFEEALEILHKNGVTEIIAPGRGR